MSLSFEDIEFSLFCSLADYLIDTDCLFVPKLRLLSVAEMLGIDIDTLFLIVTNPEFDPDYLYKENSNGGLDAFEKFS